MTSMDRQDDEDRGFAGSIVNEPEAAVPNLAVLGAQGSGCHGGQDQMRKAAAAAGKSDILDRFIKCACTSGGNTINRPDPTPYVKKTPHLQKKRR